VVARGRCSKKKDAKRKKARKAGTRRKGESRPSQSTGLLADRSSERWACYLKGLPQKVLVREGGARYGGEELGERRIVGRLAAESKRAKGPGGAPGETKWLTRRKKSRKLSAFTRATRGRVKKRWSRARKRRIPEHGGKGRKKWSNQGRRRGSCSQREMSSRRRVESKSARNRKSFRLNLGKGAAWWEPSRENHIDVHPTPAL